MPIPTPTDLFNALFPQPVTGLILLVLAAVLSLRLAVWSRQDEGIGVPEVFSMRHYVLVAWLLPPLLIFGLSFISDASIFLPRYYFTAFPAVALLLGWVLARVEPFRWRAVSMILVVAASTLVITGRKSHPNPHHENWRDAIFTLRQLHSNTAEPILFYSGFLETDFPEWRNFYKPGGMCHAGFDFYQFQGNIIGLPYSDRPDRISELRPQLDEILASNKRVWLLSRYQHGRMMDWLDPYLAAKGWTLRDLGFFDSVRLNVLEPGPAAAGSARPGGGAGQ